jgi:putative ABC transport system permease protein
LARQLGLGENAIGKRFLREATPNEPEIVVEVIGLVRDSKYLQLCEDFGPIAFLSTDQETGVSPEAQFLLRSSTPLSELIAQSRGAIAGTSPEITTDFRSFAGTVAEGLIRERLMATLSSFFGSLAALIAALGLYGVMSYLVARRANEIGIRMALGASRGHILSLILRQSATLLAIGLALGTVLALAAARAPSRCSSGCGPTMAERWRSPYCCWRPSRKLRAICPRAWSRWRPFGKSDGMRAMRHP